MNLQMHDWDWEMRIHILTTYIYYGCQTEVAAIKDKRVILKCIVHMYIHVHVHVPQYVIG
jgi:hypothetical protein